VNKEYENYLSDEQLSHPEPVIIFAVLDLNSGILEPFKSGTYHITVM
jgi:hypothetical protein